MKYNVFNGDLDRVIDELSAKIDDLQSKLVEATVELARMDDRFGGTKKKKGDNDEEEFPVDTLSIPDIVTNVKYDPGDGKLTFDKKRIKFYVRQGYVFDEVPENGTAGNALNPESTTDEGFLITRAVDCEGDSPGGG